MRVGLSAGLAVVSAVDGGRPLAVGETPRLAAELCDKAAPNSVALTGGPTGVAEAARNRFELRDTPQFVSVDGISTRMFELLKARCGLQGAVTTTAGHGTLLGLDVEMHRLLQLFESSPRKGKTVKQSQTRFLVCSFQILKLRGYESSV